MSDVLDQGLDGLDEATSSQFACNEGQSPCSGDEDLLNRFNLLSSLISTPECFSKGAREFNVLEQLIKKDFLTLTEGVGYPGESVLYAKLLDMLDDLRELVEFPYLANKNVLAVGGEFSAGKSMFLNAIFGAQGLLPTGVNPTTSIPTFLTYAEQESIRALNTFYRTQNLSRSQLAAISHAFNETAKGTSGKISFYHILKLLQVQSPVMKWRNIAFLDTPGYSKPHLDGDAECAQGSDAGNTDEEKAKQHLSAADYLIWIVSAKDGTFRHQGIEFLRNKVKWRLPLYLLVSRADQVNASEIGSVYKRICDDAKNAGFNLAGASAYSAVDEKVYCGDDPKSWFDAIDKKRKLTRWRGRFKELLNPVIQYNSSVKEHCEVHERLLTRIKAKDVGLMDEEMRQVGLLAESIVKERKKHEASIRPFVVFCEKVEKQVGVTLSAIGVSDETVSDVGLVAYVSDDPDLLKLDKGSEIAGVIEVCSKYTGCFIRSEATDKQICIRRKDMETLTDPLAALAVGRKVSLSVYDVSYATRTVTFVVRFV